MGENVKVTEEVYRIVDGRTVLAAAVGDELTAEQAARLGVSADGKSMTGIGPAQTLRVEDPSASTDDGSTDGGENGDPVLGMNAKTAIAEVETIDDRARLVALESAERDGKARKTVLDAIAARLEALPEDDGGDEDDEDDEDE